jgi:hypothetical protein
MMSHRASATTTTTTMTKIPTVLPDIATSVAGFSLHLPMPWALSAIPANFKPVGLRVARNLLCTWQVTVSKPTRLGRAWSCLISTWRAESDLRCSYSLHAGSYVTKASGFR